MTTPVTLSIQNFAQIRDARLSFGDLTVLVGAQGTGKSLALQWLKVALDGKHIVGALQEAGYLSTPVRNRAKTRPDPGFLVDLIFGTGMGNAWDPEKSVVKYDQQSIRPESFQKQGGENERAFFIPAHRSLLITDGWAAPFHRLSPDTPIVARLFSQNLFNRFSSRDSGALFPQHRVLKSSYRKLIDEAVFHGGKVAFEEDQHHAKRLSLAHGEMRLPFMTWTAGQREFTPLLLGLYHLLPERKQSKLPGIDWVIIEEPEMGLHPQAISVVMLLVLDLMWRGYRVVLATHSPYVLEAVWMLRQLQQLDAKWSLVCRAFGVPNKDMRPVAEAVLKKDYRVHYFSYGEDGKVESKDISSLDPDHEDDDVSGWGGLSEFSTRFGKAVRLAVEAKGM